MSGLEAGGDPYDLKRFVEAQQGVLAAVREELGAGVKRSHWMWFVFPQIAGLGTSPMARRYAISSMAEARAFLAHAILAPRLAETATLCLRHRGLTAEAIFGSGDAIKFRSSMTLFHRAGGGGVFAQALERFFAGRADPRTVALLEGSRATSSP